ncbi:MAG: type II secretion system protein GspN [Nitrospinota bacterium]
MIKFAIFFLFSTISKTLKWIVNLKLIVAIRKSFATNSYIQNQADRIKRLFHFDKLLAKYGDSKFLEALKIASIDKDIARILFIYISIFIAALVVFTIIRFPADSIGKFALRGLNSELHPYYLNVDTVDASSVFSYNLTDIDLHGTGSENSLLRIDSARVSFSFFSTLLGMLNSDLHIETVAGKSDINIQSDSFSDDLLQVTISGKDIDSSKLELLSNFSLVKLDSNVDIEGNLTLNRKKILDSVGDIELHFGRGTIELPKALLSDNAIKIEEATTILSMKNSSISVEEMKIKGKLINLNVSGVINLKEKLANSRINLSLKGRLNGKLEKSLLPFLDLLTGKKVQNPISLKITGRLSNPKISSTK